MPLLNVEEVSKRFRGLTAVDGVSFSVEEGEVAGIIGPNGAGKTTLFNVITGFLRPDAGSVVFDGNSITGTPAHRICRLGLCRTFQIQKPFSGLTVGESALVGALVAGGSHRAAKRQAQESLEMLGLADVADRYPGELPTAAVKLLGVAQALSTRPRLLLLDEAHAGLNPSEVAELTHALGKVRDGGTTILLIEHVMQAVMSLCDRVIVLDHGTKIAHGTPWEVANDPVVVEAYLGSSDAQL